MSDAFHAVSRLIGEPFYWPTRREIREQVEATGFIVDRSRAERERLDGSRW